MRGQHLSQRGKSCSEAAHLTITTQAVRFVAERGYALLPQYTFDAASGEWRHLRQRRPARAWLAEIDYSDGAMRWDRAAAAKRLRAPSGGAPSGGTAAGAGAGAGAGAAGAAEYAALLAEAHAQANVAEMEFKRNGGASLVGNHKPVGGTNILSEEASALRRPASSTRRP